MPGVRVSETELTVDEGSSETYELVLSTRPGAKVDVSLAAIGDDSVSVSPRSLTFNAADWETPQTVTVTAGDDADRDSGSAVIAHGTSSTDSDYNNMNPASVAVATVDDDMPRVLVSPASLTVVEGGSAVWTVVLQALPMEEVTVAVTHSGDADLSASPRTGTRRRR